MDSEDNLPLHLAATYGYETVVELLCKYGANVNVKGTALKTTTLLYATKGGHEAVVKLLLDHGTDQSLRSAMETTALHGVVRRGFEEIAKILLEFGADPTTGRRGNSTS